MQEFWISKDYIPVSDRIDDGNYAIKIFIPNKCQDCNSILEISTIGDENFSGCFTSSCDHFITYSQVWKNRIMNFPDGLIQQSKSVDPIDDGCSCGKCGLWSFMSSPNQPDNTFICYICRTRGW